MADRATGSKDDEREGGGERLRPDHGWFDARIYSYLSSSRRNRRKQE